jgi:hypothetical protein
MSVELTPAHPLPFNTVFYATVATIIPVLFLAIAVQGRLYEELLGATIRTLDWPTTAKGHRQILGRIFGSWIAGAVLLLFLAGILVSGVVGEIQAILALEWSHPVGNPDAAAQEVILLTVATGIGPVLLVEKHFRPLYRHDWDRFRHLKNRSSSADMAQVNGGAATDQDAASPGESADIATVNPEPPSLPPSSS